ncbi:hypothetical protein HK405_000736 [Cladochytrium tenue]|nr:hypothetical protein HK405_000736 [Cladochytrium tenue]
MFPYGGGGNGTSIRLSGWQRNEDDDLVAAPAVALPVTSAPVEVAGSVRQSQTEFAAPSKTARVQEPRIPTDMFPIPVPDDQTKAPSAVPVASATASWAAKPAARDARAAGVEQEPIQPMSTVFDSATIFPTSASSFSNSGEFAPRADNMSVVSLDGIVGFDKQMNPGLRSVLRQDGHPIRSASEVQSEDSDGSTGENDFGFGSTSMVLSEACSTVFRENSLRTHFQIKSTDVAPSTSNDGISLSGEALGTRSPDDISRVVRLPRRASASKGNAVMSSVTSLLQNIDGTLPEEMSVADVVEQLGRDHNWSPEEIAKDIGQLMRHRLRTVRDLRRLSELGWREITSIPLVTKDLLRQVIHDREDGFECSPSKMDAGPYSCARNRDYLKEKGITHLLSLLDASEKGWMKLRFPEDFVYCDIEVTDSPLQNLIPFFPPARNFIRQSLQQGGRVLVYCNNGISRSPAFAIAFVMEDMGLEFQHAFNLVQAKRFCMNPLEGFKIQLREYEPIFQARSAIAQQNYTPQEVLLQGQRRRRLEEEDDDQDMS